MGASAGTAGMAGLGPTEPRLCRTKDTTVPLPTRHHLRLLFRFRHARLPALRQLLGAFLPRRLRLGGVLAVAAKRGDL